MAPPPPSTLPLPERLKALVQTLQYVDCIAHWTHDFGTDEDGVNRIDLPGLLGRSPFLCENKHSMPSVRPVHDVDNEFVSSFDVSAPSTHINAAILPREPLERGSSMSWQVH
jgi:hypothetical protein